MEALKEQIRLDREIEDTKCRLAANHKDFNLMDAFSMIDVFSKGWVTAPEIFEALQTLGCFPHKDDVHLFVRRFDKDSDGRILYSDFCDAVSPKDEFLSTEMTKRPAYHIHRGYCRTHFFAQDTRDLFLSLFRIHFQNEDAAELLRKRIARRPDFNVHDAFLTIDREGNGFLSKFEMRNFLAENGIFPTENEIAMLVDRYDRNRDGRISYEEFMEELIPKTPAS